MHTVPSSNTIHIPITMDIHYSDRKEDTEDLDRLLETVQPSDKLVIMKDFNACVWQRGQNMEGRHPTHRAGKPNSTHSLLLCQGASQQRAITNTIFCLANKREVLRRHSRSGQWHLADHQCGLGGGVRLGADDHDCKYCGFLGTARLRAPRANIYVTAKWRQAGGSPTEILTALSKVFPTK